MAQDNTFLHFSTLEFIKYNNLKPQRLRHMTKKIIERCLLCCAIFYHHKIDYVALSLLNLLCFQVIFCTRRLLELSPDCDLYKVMRAESLALMKKYSEAEVEAK